jgi:6-phosphofructokinase 2
MPGNILTESELNQIEITLSEILYANDILVLSGSIAQDTETNFYAKLISGLAGRNIKVVLDSSGKALEDALNESVYLIKPNQRELAQLAGKDFLSNTDQEKFVLDLVKSQRVKFAVVSLGDKGAFIASNKGISYLSPPSVDVKSTIGAGDSMVAGLVYSILHGYSAEVMLKWGVACGAAATMSEGTDLAHKENIESILTVFNNEKGWA